MHTNKNILTCGEAMVLFTAMQHGELKNISSFAKSIAGAELNVAVGLSRLGYNVTYLSRLGNDSFGRYIHDFLTKEHISTKAIAFDDDHTTGFMLKTKAELGEDPNVEYYRKNSAASVISSSDIKPEYLQTADHLHLTGILAGISDSAYDVSISLMQKIRSQNKTISFDPNIRLPLWKNQHEMKEKINKLMMNSDWVMPGIKEAEMLTNKSQPDEIADYYLNNGVKIVAIKLGTEGTFYKTLDDEQGIIPIYKVNNVVDTVGAGDAFATGFISGKLENLSIKESIRRGNKLGSLIIQVSGDNEGLPYRHELKEEKE